MKYRLLALEAPALKFGTLIDEGEIRENYLDALEDALKFMRTPQFNTCESLGEWYGVSLTKDANESYLEWLSRSTGEKMTEGDVITPDSGIDLRIIEISSSEDNQYTIMHRWLGDTIFDEELGLIEIYHLAYNEV